MHLLLSPQLAFDALRQDKIRYKCSRLDGATTADSTS